MKQTVFIKPASAPQTKTACLYLHSLLMPQSADRWAAILQHRKSLVCPFVQQWMRPLQEKLETSWPSCCCFNITGNFFACVPTASHIHHRRGSTSKALNHFLVHSTSIVRQMSINTLLTYLVSLRLSLSPWQLSDDV